MQENCARPQLPVEDQVKQLAPETEKPLPEENQPWR